jgi:hypothetical protein
MNGTEKPLEDMDVHEKEAFNALIRPDDSYTPEGVYWADLPLAKRIGFVGSYDAKEAKRELGLIGDMIKKDPLSPIGYYFKNMVLPGAGLGLEGYFRFPLFRVRVEADIAVCQLRAVLNWKPQAPLRIGFP